VFVSVCVRVCVFACVCLFISACLFEYVCASLWLFLSLPHDSEISMQIYTLEPYYKQAWQHLEKPLTEMDLPRGLEGSGEVWHNIFER